MSKFIQTIGLALLLWNLGASAQKVSKTTHPNWVAPVSRPENTTHKLLEDQGGFQYLLLDFQDNVADKELYRHYIIKIINSEGVQAVSDISASYDPSYQKLYFHQISLIREGVEMDKLADSEINVFQRETNMERSLYDGSLTAVINLSDVREGDILEYSYSIRGFNPINKNHYSTTFYQEYTAPVNQIYSRVVLDKSRKLNFKLFNNAKPPEIIESRRYREYIWDNEGHDYFSYDNNVPSWINKQKRVSVSTLDNWKEVVDWAKELYKYPRNNFDIMQDLDIEDIPKNEQITTLIRFVQDEVRYLGLESGMGAYKPNSPTKVYKQRYGDCKDKSLLLVSLLTDLDVSAYPLLVNTQLKKEIKELLPSHNLFDHCIVYFNFENQDYFVDPTVSNQGGNLENISFPTYDFGLVIKPNTNQLIPIPNRDKSTLSITETINIDSIGGSGFIKIESEYTGAKADYIRGYFNSNSKESIKKEYANFYSSLYNEIEPAGDIKINDGLRNSYNSLYIEETYRINKLWSTTDQGVLYFEAYPLVLESLINYPVSAKRSMPYYLGEPHSFNQKTIINLPEPWNVNDTDKIIEGKGFTYKSSVQGLGSRITIDHSYELEIETIDGSEVSDLLTKNDEITKDLSFMISYDKNLEGFKYSWASILVLILALGLGIFFFLKLYRDYNPESHQYIEEKPIGGWLILPALGLILTPIVVLVQIITEDPLNHNTWLSLYRADTESPIALVLLYGVEQLYNYLFLMFSVLLIILFFQKRSSIPTLMIIFYGTSLVVPIVDLFLTKLLASNLLSDSDGQALYADIGKRFVGAAIWIPYFLTSQRVKETFIKKHSASKQDSSIEQNQISLNPTTPPIKDEHSKYRP
ncbi:DUF3857 domain-containing protein [Flavobacteriaceae bacterium TP-CH-4]|uniref:DUF3857 domain-containing protein n=1 Tax=Pelagihabitans pacificus TaxID=2696054 RepID=A0A967E4R5_9FLAO|nr:DUF3857 domain-containing protein [Pelagihabitans pacificus]NHF58667.1 DUF3857 domain-containing protein [Pelagihabitans pacificus]